MANLSPLDGSTSIEEIDARATEVKDLPQGELPSLKMLDVLSARKTYDVLPSKMEKDIAERFAQAHPGCVFVKGLRSESGGPWPGDAILTADSSSFLRKWLQERKAYEALLVAAQPNSSPLQGGSP